MLKKLFHYKHHTMERAGHHHHHHYSVTKENCWIAAVVISQITTIIFCGIFIFHSYQIDQFKSKLKSGNLKPSTFTALSLIGNEQVIRGTRYLPIRGWTIEYQYGNISFLHGTKIRVKVAGFYYVYLQMFFYQNGNRYKKTVNKETSVMHIGVVNRRMNKRLLAATISLTSCMNVCTKHVSRIIYLQNNSVLTVHTATPGIYFRMIKEKTHFGVFLLQQI